MEKHKFSGYLMVLYSALIAMASLGFGYLTLGLYVPSLITELNSSITVVSLFFSVLATSGMICNFLSAKISEKIGLKKMVIIGCLCLLAAYILLYFTTSLVMLFITAVIVGIGTSWAGAICIGRIVPNWFIKRQGTMIGIANGVMCLGSVIGSPIVSSLVASSGWRSASLVTLGIMAALTIPAMLLLKEKPSDVGQLPLGYEGAQQGESDSASTLTGLSFKEARKSVATFLIGVAFICALFLAGGISAHIPYVLVSKGFDIVFAGTLWAITSASNAVGNIVVGSINDKLGIKAALVWIWSVGIAAMVLLLLFVENSQVLAIVFSVCFGLAMPSTGTVVAATTIRAFGMKAFPQMFGLMNSLVSFSAILTPFMIGLLAGSTGNYDLAIYVVLAGLAVAFITSLTGVSIGMKLQKKLAKEPA